MTQFSGAGRILVGDRNAAAMRVFQKEIAKGKKRIGIFYGGAHMPDFERRLVLDFGMKKSKVEWLNAWDLMASKASPLEQVLERLSRDLIRELLEPANRRAAPPQRDPEKKTKKKPRRVIR